MALHESLQAGYFENSSDKIFRTQEKSVVTEIIELVKEVQSICNYM
jgi:hypothetical protein